MWDNSSDFNWIETLIISTGWIMEVANIPERPPMIKGWIESKIESKADFAGTYCVVVELIQLTDVCYFI